MAALLRASEAGLRTLVTDPAGKVVGVRPAPGAPPNNAGQWYYAVHAGAITGDQATNGQSNDKLFAVQVTITARMAYAPKDRKGDRLVLENELIDRAEAAADALHMSYDVLAAANALIPGTAEYCAANGGTPAVNGFVEPLRLESITPPAEAAGDWTGGESNPGDVLVCTVTLGGARRVRPL